MDDPANSDALALEAWRGGDEAGLRELIARHGPMVHAACRRRLGDGIDADEAAQAAFVALARRARQLRDARRVAAWLHAIAVRACAQSARARARRQRHEAAAGAVAVASRESDDEDWPRARLALDEAIAALPQTQRAAVVERFFAGRSFAEVGAALGISEDAAKKRVAAALERLRRTLARRGVALTGVALVAGLAGEASAAEAASRSALTVLTAPPTVAARRLAQEVLRMLLIRSLLTPLALAALLAAGAAIALYAEDPKPAPRHRAVDPAAKYMKLYDVRDLVGGQQLWYEPRDVPLMAEEGGAIAPDHGPDAIALERARTTDELIALWRADLTAVGARDPLVSVVYPGMPRNDLVAAIGPIQRPEDLDEMVGILRHNVDTCSELVPGLIGASAITAVTTQAGHRRLEALLSGARELRAQARVPWREDISRQLAALMPALRADPGAAEWPSRAVPAALETSDGDQKVRLRVVFLPEVPRDAFMTPILVAGGAQGRGTFLLCTDGTRVWLPEGDAYPWAEHVREVVDAGLVRAPLTNAALREAGRTKIEKKPAACVGGKPAL